MSRATPTLKWNCKYWLLSILDIFLQFSFFLDSFKDGVDLKEDGRITVNRDGGPNGSYEIVIKKVQAGDAGSYTAAASNSFGTEECVAAVTVKG